MMTSTDPYKNPRTNFSLWVHTLSSPIVFSRLNAFEKKYLGNMMKYTSIEVFPTVTMEMQNKIITMYDKYVGFPKNAN